MDKITKLKMQRAGEKKKIITVKPHAVSLSKNIFHQERNKADKKSYQVKLQTWCVRM